MSSKVSVVYPSRSWVDIGDKVGAETIAPMRKCAERRFLDKPNSNTNLAKRPASWTMRTLENVLYSDQDSGRMNTGGSRNFYGTVRQVDGNGNTVGGAIEEELLYYHFPVTNYANDYDWRNSTLPDKNGRFAILMPAGVNTIWVRTRNSLWRKMILNNGSWTSGWGSTLDLKYGDMNGDNKIEPGTTGGDRVLWNFCEAARVAMATASGEQSDYYYDLGADLNRDGFVGFADRDILISYTSVVDGDHLFP